METIGNRIIKYLRYSGASIIITVNPAHWRLRPIARVEQQTEWPSPNERMVTVGWLFLTIRTWIDDGSW